MFMIYISIGYFLHNNVHTDYHYRIIEMINFLKLMYKALLNHSLSL